MAAATETKIEKGIALPESSARRGTPPKYPWRTMEVGDSFLFPREKKSPHSQAHQSSIIYAPRKFIARLTPDGVRCWRIV